ncbi:MAG: phosphomannomutase/phosphoglucomutase [Candidatus Woesearchaeota archaeon]
MFHSYDVRGKYKSDIDVQHAYLLGVSFARSHRPKTVIIGYDARIGSDVLAHAITDGLLDEGVNVTFVGLVSTPVVWFAVNNEKADGGIMVTASHNPKEYVGFKFCTKHAKPLSLSDGLEKIQKIYNTLQVDTISHPKKAGNLTQKDMTDEYISYMLPFGNNITSEKKILFDCSNGSIGPVLTNVLKNLPMECVIRNVHPDGTFPNHSPNPLNTDAQMQFGEDIRAQKADGGIMFDGDGDRIVCFDEFGTVLPPESVLYLIVQQLRYVYQNTKKFSVVHDLRMSKSLQESLESQQIKTIKTKVGRPSIIGSMKQNKSIVGGEISGHYYFQNFFDCDDGIVAALHVLSYLCNEHETLSTLTQDLNPYSKPDEINIERTQDFSDIRLTLKERYSHATIEELDGISVYDSRFWFNIRPSNTEKLLRITLEADSEEILDTLKSELSNILGVSTLA